MNHHRFLQAKVCNHANQEEDVLTEPAYCPLCFDGSRVGR